MTSAELVDCEGLPPGSLLEVETKNRQYRIECLGGIFIRISGHPEYCPTPVSCQLQGSSDKRGTLEPGLIGRGKYMRFLLDDRRPVTTSRVIRVRVQRPTNIRPNLSSSIH